MSKETPQDMTVQVKRCSRCGEDHFDLIFHPLTNPPDEFSYWSQCPSTDEPILMRIAGE